MTLSRRAFLLLFLGFASWAVSARGNVMDDLGGAADNCWRSAGRAATSGNWELYLSGYTYHSRWTYDEARDGPLNEKAWGLGVARSVVDADGDTHSVYLLGFEDSFHHAEFQLGYMWLRMWPVHRDGPGIGLGFTLFFFSRHDMYDYAPLPGLLPVVALGSRKIKLYCTYVPKVRDFVKRDTAYIFASVKL